MSDEETSKTAFLAQDDAVGKHDSHPCQYIKVWKVTPL